MSDGSGGMGGAEFGRTWWGQAWLEALEQRARLDPDRLPRGRDYARSGAVGELTLAPGEARARVQGRKTEPYEVRIRVRRFTDDEWDRVLAAISARLGPWKTCDAAAAARTHLAGAGNHGPFGRRKLQRAGIASGAMAGNRMNREQFYAKVSALDAEQLRKVLWTLYWRGTAQAREQIEDALNPPRRVETQGEGSPGPG